MTDIERLAAITLEACGGRLDILVNNASTLGPVPMPYLLDYPVDDFQQVLNVNLVAPLLLIQNLLAAMIAADMREILDQSQGQVREAIWQAANRASRARWPDMPWPSCWRHCSRSCSPSCTRV